MLGVANKRKTLRSDNMIFVSCKQKQQKREEKQIYLATALVLEGFWWSNPAMVSGLRATTWVWVWTQVIGLKMKMESLWNLLWVEYRAFCRSCCRLLGPAAAQ